MSSTQCSPAVVSSEGAIKARIYPQDADHHRPALTPKAARSDVIDGASLPGMSSSTWRPPLLAWLMATPA
jgi:hypothetical protein